jgi:type I restriction-modification system DNA methylase subunit
MAKEAEFHGILYTRLLDYIREADTPFSKPTSEKTTPSGGSADIFVPSPLNGQVIIEVKRDDIYPRDKDVIRQARDYADELSTEFFVTCNSNDLFLFRYQEEIELFEIDFYYFNLREAETEDAIGQLLGLIETVHEGEQLPSQTDRERIVGLLRSFHSSIWPTYRALAQKKHGSNERFTQQFNGWVQENDYTSLDDWEQFTVAGKQYAYLLTNKVLFYDVVREKTIEKYDPHSGETAAEIETKSGFKLDSLHEHTTLKNLERHIQRQFKEIVDEIDYEPVFDDGASLFADFPQNRKTLKTLEDFIANIEAESITRIEEDLLGEIYEELIPVDERKALGQFYTPPKIAQTISSWAIQRSEDRLPRVLDPACGSGTFSVEAYKSMNGLPQQPKHQEILDHIVAVDINKFPLHLTALNLASQNIHRRTERLHTHNDSFFNIPPEEDRLFSSRMHGSGRDEGEMGKFDAVIANPPYIDQRDLYPDKEHFRNSLKELGPSGSSTYYDGQKRLSKRCDAYIYFVTHATRFLTNGGRLGFIIPTKWMMTGYGEGFQQFLHDHYKIQAVVGFNARAFEDAFVDGALLLVERCSDEAERRYNVTNFIRIRDKMDYQDIVDTVEYSIDLDDTREMMVLNRESYRTIAVNQSYLMDRDSHKLAHFLTAPREFIELLENTHATPLRTLIGNSSRGVTTGDNDFFIIDKEEAETRGIDERFLKPILRWIKDMEQGEPISLDTSDNLVIDVHDYVAEVEQRGDLRQSDIEERVRTALKDDGYQPLLDYIREGEARNVHTGRTCANRRVWYDVGELDHPDIFVPKGFKYRLFVSRNAGGITANNRIYCLDTAEGIDTMALLGAMNSTVFEAALETLGREEGRGMMEISKGDLMRMPTLDVRKLIDEDCERLKRAYVSMEEADGEEELRKAQYELDEVVLDIMDADGSVDRLRELRQLVTDQRNDRGTTTEVMVEQLDTLEELGTHTFTVGAETDDDNRLADFM